jgi:hypothetical protein
VVSQAVPEDQFPECVHSSGELSLQVSDTGARQLSRPAGPHWVHRLQFPQVKPNVFFLICFHFVLHTCVYETCRLLECSKSGSWKIPRRLRDAVWPLPWSQRRTHLNLNPGITHFLLLCIVMITVNRGFSTLLQKIGLRICINPLWFGFPGARSGTGKNDKKEFFNLFFTNQDPEILKVFFVLF